jgi:hypothetical protein
MHPEVIRIVARQHIADLHRAAVHDRLVHTTTTATSSHAVPASDRAAPVEATALSRPQCAQGPRRVARRFRPHRAPRGAFRRYSRSTRSLRGAEDEIQAGDCK